MSIRSALHDMNQRIVALEERAILSSKTTDDLVSELEDAQVFLRSAVEAIQEGNLAEARLYISDVCDVVDTAHGVLGVLIPSRVGPEATGNAAEPSSLTA